MITNQEPLDQILAQRDIIMESWEKVVAAVTMHYINDTASEIKALIDAGDANLKPGTSATANYEKYWGEMRGYAHGLLYNSFSKVPASNIARILEMMGTAPTYPESDNFTAMQAFHDLLKSSEMSTLMKQSFGFTDSDIANY